MGILSLLLWTPVFGVLLLICTPAGQTALIRGMSNGIAALALLLTLIIANRYDALNAALQMTERFVLNPETGNAYALGVDGLSLPMLLLATLFTCVALLVSHTIADHLKSYYLCVLLLEFGLLGVFLSQDWTLFYIFWAITLIPLFFLIDRWGGELRHTASLQFALYTLIGSMFILVGLVALGRYMPEQGGGMMAELAEAAQAMPKAEQILVLCAFLIGFSIKMALFPVHGWLPSVHIAAPTPVSILLSGVVIKMGAYGLLRVAVTLPVAIAALQPLLLGLALFGMLYGGLLAWRQRHLKAMLAYASVSQMSIIVLGVAALNLTGLTGAVLQITAHGLIAGTLFLFVGCLIARTGSGNIQEYSSLSPVMPKFALLSIVTLLAAIGLPGTVGFIAALHTIIGGFERWGGWMAFFSLSILVSAAYAVRTIGLLFMGPTKPNMQNLVDLRARELLASGLLVAAILVLGLLPTTLLDLSIATLAQLNSIMAERTL